MDFTKSKSYLKNCIRMKPLGVVRTYEETRADQPVSS